MIPRARWAHTKENASRPRRRARARRRAQLALRSALASVFVASALFISAALRQPHLEQRPGISSDEAPASAAMPMHRAAAEREAGDASATRRLPSRADSRLPWFERGELATILLVTEPASQSDARRHDTAPSAVYDATAPPRTRA
jgi:hypothetical protein